MGGRKGTGKKRMSILCLRGVRERDISLDEEVFLFFLFFSALEVEDEKKDKPLNERDGEDGWDLEERNLCGVRGYFSRKEARDLKGRN